MQQHDPQHKPVRLSVDLSPDVHQRLIEYATKQRVKMAPLVRGWILEKLAAALGIPVRDLIENGADTHGADEG